MKTSSSLATLAAIISIAIAPLAMAESGPGNDPFPSNGDDLDTVACQGDTTYKCI